ncbi:MAG: NAD(P)/FAD-dependent oxidoreductase [Clostridia bacterium]
MIYRAIVIGGGPAGLQAALSAGEAGHPVLIIERESRPGGILKQCIHDGFGVIRFGEKLSGPEYAERFIDEVQKKENITLLLLHFVISISKEKGVFVVRTTSKEGITEHRSETLVFANGCRERTSRQVNIHGTRPAGVLTAGTAQYYVNLMGALPGKRCVILGSGDIGLIMARRLTLEGAEVLGVYEAKDKPGGLTRNLYQCLTDFDIPLHLSKTVSHVFGEERVEAVEVVSVDENMCPLAGTEEIIECDTLIVSVGLIPENELAESLGTKMDAKTKGAIVDQNMMTSVNGAYAVGNALHVHDLVDYVSECAKTAGEHIAGEKREERNLLPIEQEGLLYLVPQQLDINSLKEEEVFYFRSACEYKKGELKIYRDGEEIYKKKYAMGLKPPEMEKLKVKLPPLERETRLKVVLEGKNE